MHHALPGRVASDDSSADAPGHVEGSKKKPKKKPMEPKTKKKSKKSETKDADHEPIQGHDDDDDDADDLAESNEGDSPEGADKVPRKRPATKGSRTTKKPASRGKKHDDQDSRVVHCVGSCRNPYYPI